MEKTIEEKWQAVKDFLLAKMGDSDDVSWYDQHGVWQAGWWKPNWKLTVRLIDHKINETLLMEHPYHLQSADISILYSLFGLDKRDALEAHTRKEAEFEARMNLMDAKQEKYMDLYRAERGKSAKLIEALEEINNVPTKMQESIDIYKEYDYQLKTDSELVEKIAEFGFGELEFHTADIERLVTQSGIAFNALEAYKEGKKDE